MLQPQMKKGNVVTSNSTSEIVAAIQNAQDDPVLSRLIRWIGRDDWRSWVSEAGVSESAMHLIEKLEAHHPKLSKAFFVAGGNGEIITPVLLAQWLVKRATQVGAENAYASVLKVEHNHKVTAYNVTLLSGIYFSKKIEFLKGIQLVGWELIPETIQMNVSEKINRSLPDVRPPYTFLIQPMDADIFETDRDAGVISYITDYIAAEGAIVKFLSLFADNHAPVIDRRWCLLPDDTPMAGFVDCGWVSYLEVKRPKVHEDLNEVDTDQVHNLFLDYQGIPERLRLPIDVSLWRRGQAMNSWDSVNKAIDLGVAMEAVLTVPKTREQLSLQVRILGAKLAFPAGKERTRAYTVLKRAYDIRSDAVHNGLVEKSYKIKGEGEKPVNDILNEATEILGRCLREIIRRRGLSPEQAEQLILEA